MNSDSAVLWLITFGLVVVWVVAVISWLGGNPTAPNAVIAIPVLVFVFGLFAHALRN